MSIFYKKFFSFKQRPAYEMRISYLSSDVCSSDLDDPAQVHDPLRSQPSGYVRDYGMAEGGVGVQVFSRVGSRTIPLATTRGDVSSRTRFDGRRAAADRKSVV